MAANASKIVVSKGMFLLTKNVKTIKTTESIYHINQLGQNINLYYANKKSMMQ